MSLGEDPKALLRGLEQRARRRFGQHFLTRRTVVDRIVRAAGVRPGDRVVEIGPGLGILTGALVEAGAEVTAVEVDRDLAARLREVLPAVRLVEADATTVDWRSLMGEDGEVRMVANLPYNVGTGLVMTALRSPSVFRSVTVMLQAEVVERLVARPGTKSYGALSVEAWLHGDARIALYVPPGAFHPPPKVHSAVVHVDRPDAPRTLDPSVRAVERVVKAAFAQRRKTLRNTLKALAPVDVVQAALDLAAIEANTRAEALDPEAFVTLAGALSKASATMQEDG